MDQFDDEEFGGPLFGDTSEHAVTDGESGPLTGSGLLRMDDDSGAMPHWTEQATGEVPRIDRPEPSPDPTDDLDVWSTFSGSGAGAGQGPSWRDDHSAPLSGGGLDDITGLSPVFEDPDPSPFAEPAPAAPLDLAAIAAR